MEQETICVLCKVTFQARHNYGLCKDCWTAERGHEHDKLQSAIHRAKREELPAELTLVQWLSILSDLNGKCPYCREAKGYAIHLFERKRGLIYGNVVPACHSCHRREEEGYHRGVEQVRCYLLGKDVEI